jgi:hypothetical protein
VTGTKITLKFKYYSDRQKEWSIAGNSLIQYTIRE